jgi:hypothetical protein
LLAGWACCGATLACTILAGLASGASVAAGAAVSQVGVEVDALLSALGLSLRATEGTRRLRTKPYAWSATSTKIRYDGARLGSCTFVVLRAFLLDLFFYLCKGILYFGVIRVLRILNRLFQRSTASSKYSISPETVSIRCDLFIVIYMMLFVLGNI